MKTTKLFNKTIVKEGDLIEWVDSDGNKHQDLIKIRTKDVLHGETGKTLKAGTLYMHNVIFNPCDYYIAKLINKTK